MTFLVKLRLTNTGFDDVHSLNLNNSWTRRIELELGSCGPSDLRYLSSVIRDADTEISRGVKPHRHPDRSI
jgi:hypothetical protein